MATNQRLMIQTQIRTRVSNAALMPYFGLAKATELNDIKSCSPHWMAPEIQALFLIGRGVPPPVPDSLSSDARDFILRCLQVNPNDRPTAADLLDHPYVRRPLPSSSGSSSPYNFG
ncbi:hypothetical protein CsSME_00034888 [Camellia sinensis var. sinensis]